MGAILYWRYFLPDYVGAVLYAAILPEYQIARIYAGFVNI